jgi:UPF0716 family protein affecting phage T7 exclusion
MGVLVLFPPLHRLVLKRIMKCKNVLKEAENQAWPRL